MKNIIIALGVAMFFLSTGFFSQGPTAAQEPVVKLIQAKGNVWYSTGGEEWKPVRRNKFLYEEWKVKTDPGATCKLSHQNSNRLEALEPDTEVIVRAIGTQVVRGNVTSKKSSSTLPGHLKRKLAKVQKYTTVQRAATSGDRMAHSTARWMVLNEAYPFLVWENPGDEYAYRLVVGENSFEVPGSKEPVIRYSLAGLEPGEYTYLVQILYEDEVYYTPEQMGTLVWMDREQTQQLRQKINTLEGEDKTNTYVLGSLFDDEGLKVAAMDEYRSYMNKHPGDNEIRPFLVKVLHELGLAAIREKEALLYRQNAGN